MLYRPNNRRKSIKGFTLIETIVGIVVLALSFSVLTTLIYPVTEQSADQYHQIKAAELGQTLMNEIQSKAFDDNSDFTSGQLRCGDTDNGAPDCTKNNQLGCDNDEKVMGNCSRSLFDDVDDYHEFELDETDNDTSNDFENSFGQDISDLYVGYKVSVDVCNDADYSGVCVLANSGFGTEDTFVAKKIEITVTTPTGFDMVFTSYRANF